MGDIGNFISNVVGNVAETGKAMYDSARTGVKNAGEFVARVVKDDARDMVSAGRQLAKGFGAGYEPAANWAIQQMFGKDFADATNPSKQTVGQQASAMGNSMLNVASFIPGFGAGVKAAKEGVRGSKYVKAGAKAVQDAAKKSKVVKMSEKDSINLVNKAYTGFLTKAEKKMMRSSIADAVTAQKYGSGFAKKLGADKMSKAAEEMAGLAKRYHRVSASQTGAKKAVQCIDDLLPDKRNIEAAKYAGGAALGKGIRILGKAAKSGFNAGSKQFATQSANIWRKNPGKEFNSKGSGGSNTSQQTQTVLKSLGGGPDWSQEELENYYKTFGIGKYKK